MVKHSVTSFSELKRLSPAQKVQVIQQRKKVYGICPDCGKLEVVRSDGSGCAKEVCEKAGLRYVMPQNRRNWSNG